MTDRQADEATAADAGAPSSAGAAPDRFEHPHRANRVGAHRLVIKPRRAWQYLLAGLIGVAVLTGLGILAVQSIGSGGNEVIDAGKDMGVIARVDPVLDPDATVAVLNGTTIDGLQNDVAAAITDGPWGTILFADVAASDDVTISAVFYGSEADEAVALGLAKELGGVSTYQSNDYEKYGVQLVVLLGSDYAGPRLGDGKAASDADADADAVPSLYTGDSREGTGGSTGVS
ncbi:MAG: LytR C-terminal domain-containing protein [Leucobacter sp.]|nr:LytR C-terminal domain-containing protein [Leucobacter sp.]